MNRRIISLLVVTAACGGADPVPLPPELVLVAVEGDGAIAIVDGATGAHLRTVDVSDQVRGEPVGYAVHNVQAASDRVVWATGAATEAHGHAAAGPDQLIGVDLDQQTVIARIDLGVELHPAHVVLAGGTALVTATATDEVLVVDLARAQVARRIALPAGTGPHGARLAADGHTLAVAGMGDGSLVLIDLDRDALDLIELPGRAVQAAVAPDGSAAFATIYDTRQVARVELATRRLTLFDLPAGSVGPVQLYPTPDGGRLWIADQGMLDGAPVGRTLIELDAVSGAVVRTVEVAGGPHGVVVSGDGRRVWTTTLVEGSVQAIDVDRGAVVSTTAVGDTPNGISYLGPAGAMP